MPCPDEFSEPSALAAALGACAGATPMPADQPASSDGAFEPGDFAAVPKK